MAGGELGVTGGTGKHGGEERDEQSRERHEAACKEERLREHRGQPLGRS
jgi:hypothetical protein